MNTLKTVEWVADGASGLIPGRVRMIDQTRLPVQLIYIETTDIHVVFEAIRTLQVRGAPAIGCAAALGLAADAQRSTTESPAVFIAHVEKSAAYLATARPTAVNLFWALDRMTARVRHRAGPSVLEMKHALVREALQIRDEDAAMCRAIGTHGATLLADGATVLTHCNAGSLATSEFGTALAPIYAATEQGRTIRVVADETRPLLQGARLTAWELMKAGVEVTLICDHTAAQVMKEGRINAVMVGADRIAANGDTANKIGTYGVAVLAKAHDIPFYVLAPSSTFDLKTETGAGIPIEERAAEEVTHSFGRRIAPEGVHVYSPAFDVTPAGLITAIVCEKGIIRPDFRENIKTTLS